MVARENCPPCISTAMCHNAARHFPFSTYLLHITANPVKLIPQLSAGGRQPEEGLVQIGVLMFRLGLQDLTQWNHALPVRVPR